METYGRERRHRYFTLAAYKCVMASEQLQPTTTSIVDADLSRVGDFAALDPEHFYTTPGELHSYQDSFKGVTSAKGKKRKRDEGASDREESEPRPKPKRGRPRKVLDASTSIPKKRGRPRKNTLAKVSEAKGPGPGEPPSEGMTEVCETRDGQAITTAATTGGQAIVADQQADEPSLAGPQSNQFVQNVLRPFLGSSALVDGNQQSTSATAAFSRAILPVKQSTGAPQASPSLGRCDVDVGVSRKASEEGVDNVQPRRSTKTSSRYSSKRAGTTALTVDHRSTGKKTSEIGLGSRLLEKDGFRRESPASVAEEEEYPAMSSASSFRMSSRLGAHSNSN